MNRICKFLDKNEFPYTLRVTRIIIEHRNRTAGYTEKTIRQFPSAIEFPKSDIRDFNEILQRDLEIAEYLTDGKTFDITGKQDMEGGETIVITPKMKVV